MCSKVKPIETLSDLLVNLICDIPSLRNIFKKKDYAVDQQKWRRNKYMNGRYVAKSVWQRLISGYLTER